MKKDAVMWNEESLHITGRWGLEVHLNTAAPKYPNHKKVGPL